MAKIFNNPGSAVDVGTVTGNLTVTTTNIGAQPYSEPEEIFFNVRSAVLNFVGRSSQLEECMKITSESSFTQPHIIVISGLGGIGKTQLVRRFIERNRSAYKNVIWINAEKTDLISESFTKLAERLNISSTLLDGKAKDINSVIEEVFTKLCKRKTLFVYDNVDNIENLKFLLTIETSREKPHVMITSRIKEWGNEIPVINLMPLDLDEANTYVTKTLINAALNNDSDDDIKLLVETLQFFPLALRQATAHINYHRANSVFQISDYVAKYDTQEILNCEFFTKIPFDLYEKTTFTTWKITIDAIEQDSESGQLAVTILNVMAYFEPENIHRDIFNYLRQCRSQTNKSKIEKSIRKLKKYLLFWKTDTDLRYEQEQKENKIISAVRLLVNYSMVDSKDQIQTILSVHRLVQKVVKLNLQETNQETSILHDALELISNILQTKHKIVKVSLPHAMSVFLSALKFKDLIKEFSILPSQILSSSITHIKYNQAKAFSDKIQKPLMNILGENHKHMLSFKSDIGLLYHSLGLNNEALEMFLDVFEKRKVILGDDHPSTLTTRHNIASSYGELGNHSKALEMFLDVFEKEKVILGDDHPSTLATRHNIASSYRELRNHSKALEMFLDVFEKRKIILGVDHPYTLRTRSNIASSYRELGNHSKALEMFLDVFEKMKLILGDDHPSTLTTRSNIASSYRELGNHSKALEMFLDVFEKMKIILGVDHPYTLRTRSNIASSYRELGNHSKALEMFLDVFEKMKIILGVDHPYTLRTRSNIASSYRELGNH